MASATANRINNPAITRLLALLAWAIAAGTMAHAARQPTGVTHVTLNVDGLACPFCAYGLEKQLRKWPAVEQYDIDLKQGRIQITAKPGATLRLKDLADIIQRAGFTHGDGTLVATGVLEKREKTWILRPDDHQTFTLSGLPENAAPESGATVSLRGAFSASQMARTPAQLTEVELVTQAPAP